MTVTSGAWAPGNEYRFTENNTVGLRHGAWSPRTVDPVAGSMVEQLLANDDVAYLRQRGSCGVGLGTLRGALRAGRRVSGGSGW